MFFVNILVKTKNCETDFVCLCGAQVESFKRKKTGQKSCKTMVLNKVPVGLGTFEQTFKFDLYWNTIYVQ